MYISGRCVKNGMYQFICSYMEFNSVFENTTFFVSDYLNALESTCYKKGYIFLLGDT
jgi:hypothetical protein